MNNSGSAGSSRNKGKEKIKRRGNREERGRVGGRDGTRLVVVVVDDVLKMLRLLLLLLLGLSLMNYDIVSTEEQQASERSMRRSEDIVRSFFCCIFIFDSVTAGRRYQ